MDENLNGGGLPTNETPPVPLISGQERVAGYIDGLNVHLKAYAVKPSSFLEGAAFVCGPSRRNNSDWKAQAAHSLREIGYMFSGPPGRRDWKQGLFAYLEPVIRKVYNLTHENRFERVRKIIRTYLAEAEAAELAHRFVEMTHILADISHHSRNDGEEKVLKRLKKLGLALDTDTTITDEIFLGLVREFLETIRATISANLIIHEKIDDFRTDLQNSRGTKRHLAFLLASTPDARNYFYATVDADALDWLWENGFLDVIRKKATDTTRYSYQTPELDYLSRVVEKNPSRVTDFMLDVTISKDTFNPEVVDRFLWISSKLPADQLARLAPKIRGDGWVRLMGPFNRWGFEYKQMLDTLAAAKDYESIITLSDAVLSVRSKENVEKSAFGSVRNPFYFTDLHYSEVFERLSEVDDSHAQAAMELALKAFGEVVLLSGEKEDDVFSIGDLFSLFDINFFTLELGHERHLSSRDDVRDLAALAKILATKVISEFCGDEKEARRLYEKCIAPLPDARTMWRFRLYVWSLCPDVFQAELKTAFFRGIESEKNLWPVTGGAEYEEALKLTFSVLSEVEQREFIDQAFKLFESLGKTPYGFGILSSVYSSLSEDDKKRAETLFTFPLKEDYSPETSIGTSFAGTVVPQPPPGSEDKWKRSVPEIVKLLKTEWTPEAIQKANKKEDFLRPINAEGTAGMLITNIKERLPEYVASANLFFDRDALDAHYTYSFLRAIQENIREDRTRAATLDWGPMIALSKTITESGTAKEFEHKREKEQFDAWLAGWGGVLSNLSDVIKELLHDENGKSLLAFESHRDELLGVMRFLLSYPDPQPADEKIETAKMKSKAPGEDEYQVSDPLTTAINTTRGRAFETFIYFVQQDGKKFPKDAAVKLAEDTQKVYEDALDRENTRALMFMYGNYIAFFHSRNPAWMEKVIWPRLFSKDPDKKDLYLAAWEGYLSASLYDELFKKLHDEYIRAIALDPNTYTKRRYRSNLDEALATHISLAYVHFKDFGFDSDLYQAFWSTSNSKRWGEFISFIGRSVISRDRPKDWLIEHPEVDQKKLEAFWDWALEHCDDKAALQEFGFWMQTKDGIFDSVWLADHIDRTLEKTNGNLDWEIGFVDSLPDLAKVAPDKTLSALRRHLIDGNVLKEARGYIRVDKTLTDVLGALYANASTKDGTYKLIDELLPIGHGQFWGLKDILK